MMNTRLRKSLTAIAASAALLAGGLVTAIPASAESVNKTDSFPTTYDNSNKVVYGKMYYARNKDSSDSAIYIYKLTVSTTSKIKQTVYWNVWCGDVGEWSGYDVFTGSSTVEVNKPMNCGRGRMQVTYSTTQGASAEIQIHSY